MPKTLPLTEKRERWARNRDVNLKGTKLAHNAGVENRFAKALRELVDDMTQQVLAEVRKLFKQTAAKEFIQTQEVLFATDDTLGSQARIKMNALAEKFKNLFASKAKAIGDKWFEQVEKSSSSNMQSSLKQLTGGLALKTSIVPAGYEDVAKSIIAENVNYIESIPAKYLTDVTGAVMRSITQGRGIADLIPEIQKYDGQTYRRAKLIALDQTRKAYNTINKQRLGALGVKKFQWVHTAGSVSPRKSHQKIDGHIFSFENLEEEQTQLGVPPEDRGLPAIPPNCRCVIMPVIEFGEQQSAGSADV